MYDNINLGRRIDPLWPDESWRARGGRNDWKNWLPDEGMEGVVVHRWAPCHREVLFRSHVDKTILLLRIGERFVPIVESAARIVGSGGGNDNDGGGNRQEEEEEAGGGDG